MSLLGLERHSRHHVPRSSQSTTSHVVMFPSPLSSLITLAAWPLYVFELENPGLKWRYSIHHCGISVNPNCTTVLSNCWQIPQLQTFGNLEVHGHNRWDIISYSRFGPVTYLGNHRKEKWWCVGSEPKSEMFPLAFSLLLKKEKLRLDAGSRQRGSDRWSKSSPVKVTHPNPMARRVPADLQRCAEISPDQTTLTWHMIINGSCFQPLSIGVDCYPANTSW